MQYSSMIMTRLGAVVIMSPLMLIPGSAVFILGALCGYLYINAQLSAKREMSLAQGPVLGNFGAAIAGLGSFGTVVTIYLTHIDRFPSFHSSIWRPRYVSPGIVRSY